MKVAWLLTGLVLILAAAHCEGAAGEAAALWEAQLSASKLCARCSPALRLPRPLSSLHPSSRRPSPRRPGVTPPAGSYLHSPGLRPGQCQGQRHCLRRRLCSGPEQRRVCGSRRLCLYVCQRAGTSRCWPLSLMRRHPRGAARSLAPPNTCAMRRHPRLLRRAPRPPAWPRSSAATLLRGPRRSRQPWPRHRRRAGRPRRLPPLPPPPLQTRATSAPLRPPRRWVRRPGKGCWLRGAASSPSWLTPAPLHPIPPQPPPPPLPPPPAVLALPARWPAPRRLQVGSSTHCACPSPCRGLKPLPRHLPRPPHGASQLHGGAGGCGRLLERSGPAAAHQAAPCTSPTRPRALRRRWRWRP